VLDICAMHPELLDNPQFLRSYEKWQRDTSSIAFIPVAEYFLKYGLNKEALDICSEGLRNHPNLISAKLLMAKILIKLNRHNDALSELEGVLSAVPNQPVASQLLSQIQNTSSFEIKETKNTTLPSAWHTVTMANIHAKQGNIEEAKKIYETILSLEPNNAVAKKGLESLGQVE
jgi:tetratricopeptide (TPR) repeat protein